MIATPLQTATIENNTLSSEEENYALILQSLGLKYKPAEYYWQVGEISKTQGWILHLSIVLSQIRDMLENIIPLLAKEQVPFKVAMTDTIAEDILNGNLGLAKIGKIVSIYPDTNIAALDLAKSLIAATKLYTGPIVPTDINLDNIVYTRYGSFNPIIKLTAAGIEEKYIYSADNQLIQDPFSIPFRLPKDINWPFQEITAPRLADPPKLQNRLYKLLDVLKPDPRGNVYKGLYVKSLFRVKQCVIKQGFSGMSSDKAGRDIQDRLIWQNELYKELSDAVPLPVIYDLFKEKNSTVLVMQFINGKSLLDKLLEINPLFKSWLDIPFADTVKILSYAIEITKIIHRMHQRGYVHRDIVPVNFLIDKNDKIFLIDIELAYSLKKNTPNPPFKLGTFGFMSPQQEAVQCPTTYEDIYGLGATLLYLFTGIYPIKFNSKNTKVLEDNLNFFIGNRAVAEMIAACKEHSPQSRPSIAHIEKVLSNYKAERNDTSTSTGAIIPKKVTLSKDLLERTITTALNGLTKPPIIIQNSLWYSKYTTAENYVANKNKQYSVFPGLTEGICGVIYALARVHHAGFSIDSCAQEIKQGLDFLGNNHFIKHADLSPGLYRGSAGFALTLAQALPAGLLVDTEINITRIQTFLNQTNEDLTLANGIAGQGLALLQCKQFMSSDNFKNLLGQIVCDLLSKQQNDGSWLNSMDACFNIGYDDTGILCFLLEYLSRYRNPQIEEAVLRGLTRITSNTQYINRFHRLTSSRQGYEIGDGGKGLILILIKAYEIFQKSIYKKMAEDALLNYPPRIVHNNINQETGLAAIGELYLKAWQAFEDEKWKDRSDWIANVFIHSLNSYDGCAGHWVMEQNNPPTADLFTGNSGIIHYLARCFAPDKIGYRMIQ